jgi:Lantibiotic dehydratase, N terminus
MSGPVWMLRINPMMRRRLADPTLAELVEQAAALARGTEALAEAAGDDLYRLIPAAPEHLRGPLLALRRSIHNDRDGPGLLDGPASIEWPASVIRWSDHKRRRLACDADIRGAHEGALARERSLLRERLGEGNFLTTLAQSASGVYDAAVRYCRPGVSGAGGDALDSRDRKAERSLVQFLTRAMVRTSPYGRFTAVGLARPDPAGVAMDAAGADTASAQLDVDRPMFDYVMGGLVPADDDPLLALPPTARVSDDRITFFQVGADGIRRLAAPLNPPTQLLVELLELGPCRQSVLAAALSDRLARDETEAQRLLSLAVRLGLVVTAWRGDRFLADPVDAAVGELPESECLGQFRTELDRLDEAGDRVAERIAVSRRLDALGTDLSREARRPAKLTVTEDFVLDPVLVDPGQYRPALDDLAAVTDLLCTFDRMHVVRALVAAALVERFGPGCRVPLVEHAPWLVRAVYRAEAVLAEQPDAPLGPADGSLAMLAKIRHEALAALLPAGLPGDQPDRSGPDEVCWSPADVTDLVAGVPERFRLDPASYGLVVQAHRGDLIVNDTYAGHGPMMSRFLHADRLRGGDSIARLRSRLEALYGPGFRLLEDGGSHSLSINAHPRILAEALAPEGWQALRLVHDVATDAVTIVDAEGTPVKVLALGAELPELFPYPVRLATWLCSSGRVVLDVAARLHRIPEGARSPGSGPPPTTVTCPRLRVGRVVLSRRRWYLGRDFPARRDSSGDIDYLLALTRWRARHGVPAEVMLKTLFDGPTNWETLSDTESREQFFEVRRQAKPQYVDLASALMTRILPRLLERRPGGCVEEALPGLADGGHAQEWMVEMARPADAGGFDCNGGVRRST